MTRPNACVPPGRPHAIPVRVALPDTGAVLRTSFALRDTVSDVVRFVLPALPARVNAVRQLRVVACDGRGRPAVVTDHLTALIRYRDRDRDYRDRPVRMVAACVRPRPRARGRDARPKPGKTYGHAAVQTETESAAGRRAAGKSSRAVQTVRTRDASTDVDRHRGAQTADPAALLATSVKRISAFPRNIFLEPEPAEDQNEYVHKIQRFWRRWSTRKKFELMLERYKYISRATFDEERDIKNIVYAERQRAIINLQYPTKTEDFEALYSAVDQHDANVKNRFESAPRAESTRIEDNRLRLAKKCECLRGIADRRFRAKQTANENKWFQLLNDVSEPISMTGSNGKTVFVETPETYQAKQLTRLFTALRRNDLNKNERIEFLRYLKEMLECFKKTNLTTPIVGLIDRELILLNVVHLNDGQLKTLRKRIEILFLCFIMNPDINPALKRTPKHVKLVKCFNCRRLKSPNMIVAVSNLKRIATCDGCRHLRRITSERISLAPHEVILQNIKTNEMKLSAESSIAFMLTVEDIYYLVTVIWKAKSAVSESKDTVQLRLVRWCKELDWSPSNTILLTIEEAYVHSKVYDLNKTYTSTFIDGIRLKHMIAKKYFKELMDKALKCDHEMERREYVLYN